MRLRQVLLNLLSNAVKYNRDGGRVTDLGGGGRRSDVVLSVADNGRGMDAQQLQHLFEPFNRLGREGRRRSRATGIGLAIVKSLVERMGGSVAAQQRAGSGSVFEVRLPAAARRGDGHGAERCRSGRCSASAAAIAARMRRWRQARAGCPQHRRRRPAAPARRPSVRSQCTGCSTSRTTRSTR